MVSRLAALVLVAVCLAGSATAARQRAAPTLPPPSFRPAVGWWTLSTGPTTDGTVAPEVWAASDRGTDQEALFNLFVGLKRLTSNGIVIWAADMGRGGPTRTFTEAKWPLKLGSFRLDQSWQGRPAANVQQRLRWATVAGWHLDVRVYFGTQHPTEATLAKAQAELNRLKLPAP
ncbi:MAG TPA: hypothetical protein VMU72_03710 [Gaiellaceae bacterium]|nr:hypothetical protein [Gaiellaceae bacterium]